MNLEDDLRRALRRTTAPPGFAEGVSGRLKAAPTTGTVGGKRRWLAAAAVITLLAAGGARYYQLQQMAAEAERIEAEIRLALQITAEKLELVQRKVNDFQR